MPLLHVADGKDVKVIFTRQTDMRHIDSVFRGPKPTFEEDMAQEERYEREETARKLRQEAEERRAARR